MKTCGLIYNSFGHRCGRDRDHSGPCRVENPEYIVSLGSGNVWKLLGDSRIRRAGFFRDDGTLARRWNLSNRAALEYVADTSDAFVRASSLLEARLLIRSHRQARSEERTA